MVGDLPDWQPTQSRPSLNTSRLWACAGKSTSRSLLCLDLSRVISQIMTCLFTATHKQYDPDILFWLEIVEAPEEPKTEKFGNKYCKVAEKYQTM